MTDPVTDSTHSRQLLEHMVSLALAIAQTRAYLQESGLKMKACLRLHEEPPEQFRKAVVRMKFLPMTVTTVAYG